MVALALRELIPFNREYLFAAILPIDGELLAHKLTGMFLRYHRIGAAGGDLIAFERRLNFTSSKEPLRYAISS
jgi:hypothetical protein